MLDVRVSMEGLPRPRINVSERSWGPIGAKTRQCGMAGDARPASSRKAVPARRAKGGAHILTSDQPEPAQAL